MPKYFLLTIYKIYIFFCHNSFFLTFSLFRALWSKFTFQKNIKNEFSTLYSGFHFWTFINVHFSKPKILLGINLTNNRYYCERYLKKLYINCEIILILKYLS